MNLLEAEPTTASAGASPGNEHRDQLAVPVASGKAKEMIGIKLTQDQVKKNLMKKVLKNTSKVMRLHYPQKTCDAIVDTYLELSCKTLAHFLPVDSERLFVDLNENFMVKKNLMIAGRLSLN